MMQKALSVSALLLVLGLFGILFGSVDTVEADQTKQAFCGGSGTCTGTTYQRTSTSPFPGIYQARSRSASTGFPDHGFAWTKGTNIAGGSRQHVGEAFAQSACNYYGYQSRVSCYAGWADYCTNDPVNQGGCGSDSIDHEFWYATTWHYFKEYPQYGGSTYSFFTAANRVGPGGYPVRDNSACWTNMNCL